MDSPSAAALSWQWVIEAVADLNHGNTSLLGGLIKSNPNFMIEAPEPVKERVVLRYLQERVGSRACAPPPSSGAAGWIGTTSSSEKVLCRYLREVTSLSSLEKDRADSLGHEAHSFILERKANLPKASLELLRESILEGRAPLKNHDGPVISDHVDIRESDMGDYVAMKRRKLSTDDWRAQSDQFPSVAPANNHDILLENQGNVQHPLKQDKLGSNKQCSVQEGNADSSGSDALLIKHKLNCKQLSQMNSDFQYDDLNGSENCISPPSRGHSAGTPNIVPETPSDGNDDDNIPQRNNPHSEMLDTEKQQFLSAQKTSNHDTATFKWTPSDGNKNDNAHQRSNPDTEMLDTENQQFPSAQKTSNHDTVTFKRTEKDLCTKCDKGGNLLTCSNSGCFIAVHENCLGTSANFDENGLFCCAFCSYARAFNTYRRAKRDFSRAGKELSAFLGKDLTYGLKKESIGSGKLYEATPVKLVAGEGQGHRFCSDQFQKKKKEPGEQLQKNTAINTYADGDFLRGNVEALTCVKRIECSQNTGVDGQRIASKKFAHHGKSLYNKKKSHFTHKNSNPNLIDKHKGVSEASGLVSTPDHMGSTENAEFDDCNLPDDANNTFHLRDSYDDGTESLGQNLIDKAPLHRKEASGAQEKSSANNGPINSSDKNVPYNGESQGHSFCSDQCQKKQNGPGKQLQKKKAINTCAIGDFLSGNDETFTCGKIVDGSQNTGVDGQRIALEKLTHHGKSRYNSKKSHFTHKNSNANVIDKHEGGSEGPGLISTPGHMDSTENAPFDGCNFRYEADNTFHLRGGCDDCKKSLQGQTLMDKVSLHRKEASEEQEKTSTNNVPVVSSDKNVPYFQGNEGDTEGNEGCSEGKRRDATLDGNELNDVDQNTNKLFSSKYRKKHKPSRRYSNPVIIQARRTKLLWTKEEEEMLKVAVKKFAVNDDRSYPWTKMLDFGHHVFHNTRQPGDLKDKWRNIRNKEGI